MLLSATAIVRLFPSDFIPLIGLGRPYLIAGASKSNSLLSWRYANQSAVNRLDNSWQVGNGPGTSVRAPMSASLERV